jgi:hypothetical protein
MTTTRKPYVPQRNAEEVKAMKQIRSGTLPKASPLAPVTLSRPVAEFLAELLANTTIRPTADDFEEVAAKMGKARRELIAALTE